jgi:hypothetical protein
VFRPSTSFLFHRIGCCFEKIAKIVTARCYAPMVIRLSTLVTRGDAHAPRSASSRSAEDRTEQCKITSPPRASTMILSASISALRVNASSILDLTSKPVTPGRNRIEFVIPFIPFDASCGPLGSLSLVIPPDLSFERYPFLTTAWMPFELYCSCALNAETTSCAISGSGRSDVRVQGGSAYFSLRHLRVSELLKRARAEAGLAQSRSGRLCPPSRELRWRPIGCPDPSGVRFRHHG